MVLSFILTIILLIFIHSSHAEDEQHLFANAQLLNDKKASSPSNTPNYQYVCIVDAGSTGSRIHVYKYTKSADLENNGLIEVDVENEKYQKFYPGLSSFESKPTDIHAMGEYLEPILNFGRDNVPLSKRTDTPLFVLASAGMRKVRERNEKTAQQIIDITYKYLSESSEFIVLRKGIRIIEGSNEGLWGWIAANYLNGELSNLLQLTSSNLYSSQTTKGVLEMGGESLQITFIPPATSLNSLNTHPHAQEVHHIEKVKVGDVEFELFTYSWMGIGMEAAQNRFDSYLATNTQQRDASPCYIQGDLRERAHGIGQAITWKGSGNFAECYNALKDMIDQRLKGKCEIPKIEIEQMMCTPNSILMPKIDLGSINNEFYYIENFYYTAQVLGLLNVHGQEFLNKLMEKGKYYCSLDIDKAKKEFPNASEEEIKKTCFCAAWLLAILNNGFSLGEFGRFSVIRDIEEKGNIDWALGYLVAEVPNMNMNDGEGLFEGTYTFRFLLIMMVILGMIYCWYKGIQTNTDNNNNNSSSYSSSKYWFLPKVGMLSSGNNKKEGTNNKYAYQRLNNRRTV